MKSIPLVQIGLGGVGRELARQLLAQRVHGMRHGSRYRQMPASGQALLWRPDFVALLAFATGAAGNKPVASLTGADGKALRPIPLAAGMTPVDWFCQGFEVVDAQGRKASTSFDLRASGAGGDLEVCERFSFECAGDDIRRVVHAYVDA